MAIGFLSDTSKLTKSTVSPEPTPEPAAHVVGKPNEVEPREVAATPEEAPEAAAAPVEAPDAGYGRCTESSNWEERGRNWS